MQFIKSKVICFISVVLTNIALAQEPNLDFYTDKIQPIFNNRCLACHSCYNAPCQLNLQSYEGFERGAIKFNVYDVMFRSKSIEPTRLWVDAQGVSEWRKKGFFELNTSKQPDENIFFNFVKLRTVFPHKNINKQVADSQVCASSVKDVREVIKTSPELGMPYGLPPLTAAEMGTLDEWIKNGAKGPQPNRVKEMNNPSPDLKKQIVEWEQFLNGSEMAQQLVSRYIYEHLFLAHIYFPPQKNEFFRLVRSKTACEKGVEEVITRRPNDDPGVKQVYYCFKKFSGTAVVKTHIPFELSKDKLNRYKEIFGEQQWKITALPSYETGVAENPFITFKNIPAKARYQFLLEDAQYHTSTFIKGPVCNGTNAVNSIQEQFYVFFLDPKADNMVLNSEYQDHVQNLLTLPGVWGSDVQFQEAPLFYKKLMDHRENYRKTRTAWQKKLKPNGYVLKDIWNGDGTNDNAVLTVFRHNDNAAVFKGAIGDLPKTAFVLDYPLFERLVYNLVVNFDLFGSVNHQVLTRIYMDMIRMEAEELFLMFLPPEDRLAYRQEWYRGLLAQAKVTYIFPTVGSAEPSGVRFTKDHEETKKQMIQKILFYRLSEKSRGKLDRINWKELGVSDAARKYLKADSIEQQLRTIASVKAEDEHPFARYFPDLSFVKIVSDKKEPRVFSIIHNEEHENISWILAETFRKSPDEDSLTVMEGFAGSYPNMIFHVQEKELASFVQQLSEIKSEKDYQLFKKIYGVSRKQGSFWQHYDELNLYFQKSDPINFGYLDLTRYEIE